MSANQNVHLYIDADFAGWNRIDDALGTLIARYKAARPRPLEIDGREYSRRQRARQGRRR